MASCDDDDFSLLGDDHHHQSSAGPHHHLHQPYAPHSFSSAVTPVQPVQSEQVGDAGEVYGFDNDADGSDKRNDRDDVGDGTTSYGYKRPKLSSGGEYRKDREEWSDAAIVCLLEAYTDKFTQLNRGNLRGRDWEEVAAIVSERCENQTKSVEQCKNKVDNLKKRYKLERHRMTNGCISASHWPWFKQMEQIVGNSLSTKYAPDEDKAIVSAGNSPKQSKRYAQLV